MRNLEEIEAAARTMRIRLGIDDQLRPDMLTVIFKLKHLGYIKNYVRVPDTQMSSSEAFFDPETGILHISERTFCAANELSTRSKTARRRARYTLAHEVGHVTLGHDAIRHRGASNNLRQSSLRTRIDEAEANQFAAAFLVPSHLID